MTIDCSVPGCSEDAAFKLEYRDSMGSTFTECRCPTCSRTLIENEKNTILEEEQLRELREEEKEHEKAIKDVSDELSDDAIQRLRDIIDSYGGAHAS